MIFNVSELITYPIEHELLHQAHACHYKSTTERNWQYDNGKISFNKTTQILNVASYNNDWMALHYYYRGGGGPNLNDITIYFVFPRSIIYIRTCMFKCGSCSQHYNTCDYGSCKRNFAMLRDSSIDDNDCYPNDQNMPNFIYDNTTGYYEKCFHSCKFCSKKESLSTNSEHNCLTCREGYLRSYEYPGNCYKIDNMYNNSNYKKIVNNREDESYTIVNNCIGKNIIAST
jgi:hypothetical protein